MSLLTNPSARAEYEILVMFQAGLVLTGAEVKSLKNKSGSLRGAFVKIIGNEAFLMGAQITPYKYSDNREYDSQRTRKLLLHRREIAQLMEATAQKGRTLVPLSLFLSKGRIKLDFAIARGKKQYQRKEELKRRDIKREAEREVKVRIRG